MPISDLEAFVQSLGVSTKSDGTDVGYNDFNVDCPYCGFAKHLGIHRESGYINCWVCKFDGVRPKPTLARLVQLWADVPWSVAKDMLRKARQFGYLGKPAMAHAEDVVWPAMCHPFDYPVDWEHDRDVAYSYIKARGITIADIKAYRLRFTPRSPFDSYAGRIIIPVMHNGVAVNWIGRDYTGLSQLKYKNARTDLIVTPMSHLLWGMDDFVPGTHLRICEGFFDAATLGRIAVSVQKSTLSPQQLKLVVAAKPSAVSILFDPATEKDQYVRIRALEAAKDVSAFVRQIKLVELAGGDVAELGASAVLRAESAAVWLRV